MAIEITIPRLGWNMEEGIFAGWLKRDGERVRAGEAIFSLESDKATQDIECLDNGILRIPPTAPGEGQTLPVGTVIAYLVQPGEAAPFEASSEARALQASAGEKDAHVARVSSKIEAVTADQAPQQSRRSRISPRARRIAGELGIDCTNLSGTGRTGRIRERDVRAAAERQCVPVAQQHNAISGLRRTIAARMLESHRATAPVTLHTTADATNLVNLHAQFKATVAGAPSYTDFIVKLCAFALREHPSLNARWDNDRIIQLAEIHIGIAVDTGAGLYVPVLRDVYNAGLHEIAARAQNLIGRARNRKLNAADMQGGTFTVTNLGSFGIDAFTPIINYPECAILGVGRIQRLPVVREEQIVIRDQITLSLTFDHRALDGAPAARFMQALTRLIENPAAFLQA